MAAIFYIIFYVSEMISDRWNRLFLLRPTSYPYLLSCGNIYTKKQTIADGYQIRAFSYNSAGYWFAGQYPNFFYCWLDVGFIENVNN